MVKDFVFPQLQINMEIKIGVQHFSVISPSLKQNWWRIAFDFAKYFPFASLVWGLE